MLFENVTVKELFNQLAVNGYIGDPGGALAYCYIRVSSAQQADEGRTGLPRQIQHCHEVATVHHLKIPWEMVLADDGFTGFEFENRPALTQLRNEMKKEPRSRYVVIEHIDRLSRNARWHQGFLLDEFSQHKMTPLFWKAFNSEIERAVLGTVAEEGMRSEISRMREGVILKAKSGRITAKRPRFGYQFVDGEGSASEKARKDTHYAIDPATAPVVRWIYHSIIRDHRSLGQVAKAMNAKGIPTRFNGKIWCAATVWCIVSDAIYKGDFYAHRFFAERTGEFDERGHPRGVMRQRPPEEWIKIAAPPIVSPAEWQLAQDVLESNQKRSVRNMRKRDWLLSSFIKCDICHYAFTAQRGGSQKQNFPIRYYQCNGRNSERARLSQSSCHSPNVRADQIEAFVWSKVEELILNPELFIQLLEQSEKDEVWLEEEQQLKYLETQLSDATVRFERWKTAYEASVISLMEYQEYRNAYLQKRADLEEAKREIEAKIGKRVSQADQRKLILAGLTELQQGVHKQDGEDEIPFERKRRILQQLLDCIWVDTEKGIIRFEGVLKASYGVEETEFVFDSDQKSR